MDNEIEATNTTSLSNATIQSDPPSYVQRALDQVREDMVELDGSLNEFWDPFCVDKKDLLDRVENWRYNTWRRMEEILQGREG